MSIIVRNWKSVEKGSSNWIIWDRGDEMWELRGGALRHFEVLDRSKNGDAITERLRLLKESAIPLEAIRHSVQDWEVEDSLEERGPPLPLPPLSTPALASPVSEPKNRSKKPSLPRDERTAPLQPKQKIVSGSRTVKMEKDSFSPCLIVEPVQQPSQEKIHPVKPLLQAEAQQEEDSLQQIYNHPTELWSSLSQWIPHHALFQPSLHHQASLELSDTPAQTYHYQIDSSENSRSAQAQHQRVRPGPHSKAYRPKPSLQEIEIPKRPLFV